MIKEVIAESKWDKINRQDMHIMSDYINQVSQGRTSTFSAAERKNLYDLFDKHGVKYDTSKGTVDGSFMKYAKAHWAK